MSDISIAGTGHRPPRLGLDYSPKSNETLTLFAKSILLKIAANDRILEVTSGFAQGWDLALAHAAVMLEIPLVAAVPFESHPSKWPESAQKRYHALLKRAKHVEIICPGPYAGWKFIERDKWMVRRAKESGGGLIVALWDAKKEGGTWKTIKYANEQNVPVMNCWQIWKNGVSLSGDPNHENDDSGTSRLRQETGR